MQASRLYFKPFVRCQHCDKSEFDIEKIAIDADRLNTTQYKQVNCCWCGKDYSFSVPPSLKSYIRYKAVNNHIDDWRIIADFVGLRAGSAIVEALSKLETGEDFEGQDAGVIARLSSLLKELQIKRG